MLRLGEELFIIKKQVEHKTYAINLIMKICYIFINCKPYQYLFFDLFRVYHIKVQIKPMITSHYNHQH